jgi:hypothetical protein
MSRWIPGLALVLGLGIATSAHAERGVDWSQYLEPKGARPMPVRASPTVATADAPAARSRGKQTKVTKKPAKKSPAKAKRKARAGKRR